MTQRTIEFIVLLVASIVLGKGLFGGIILGIVYGIGKFVYTKYVKKDLPESVFSGVGLGALAGLVAWVLRIIF